MQVTVAADGEGPISYQWRVNGERITDATGPLLDIPDARELGGATFDVLSQNSFGQTLSNPADSRSSIPSLPSRS
jgi:hypothetical protein